MSGGFRSRSKGAEPGKQEATPSKARPQRSRPKGGKPTGKKGGPEKPAPRKFPGLDAPRQLAHEVLTRVREDEAYANLILPRLLKERKIVDRDAAFTTEITYGTLRTMGVLDAVIAESSTRSLDQIAPEVLDALRLGAYQLLYTRVEPHAAVDTTVRLVEATGNEHAKGFANAIMRTISRTPPEKWIEILTPPGEIAAAAFRNAHPTWIAESFSRVLGLGDLEDALSADSERPGVHLVARPGEISAEELALITGGEEGEYSPYAVHLGSGDPGDLEPVREGLAAVQDEGSQLVARAVVEASLEGEDTGRWLDLCAGPGGKAALMGALARIDAAHVDAVEVSPHRAKLVEKITRGLPVTVHVADGRDPGLEPGYDRVLVDAPCSGLGALRRRPEARWRKSESDIAGLSPLQYDLLASALKLVRPGGVVVYSTCSPDLRETRAIVDKAVKELGAVEVDAHDLVAPMSDVGNEKSVQMWPHRHGTDAMFFAVLRRGEGN
ncbi:RsmB/NOP family class I SAM-dependent RNA methyltransferase [Corynebacterium comes]|uniref:Ribosomal RNA small subunit methyltransferase B n=1 Tax=Corynebacterium comes TaxID=2675218 RepID=A0A6B8W497_9CORY|nr:transcription antitermination factor NusB [Corynebacterium comes]QGU04680.1 Ribosomal RNA small subunit methyltransferase B [Corynebacterium comes]